MQASEEKKNSWDLLSFPLGDSGKKKQTKIQQEVFFPRKMFEDKNSVSGSHEEFCSIFVFLYGQGKNFSRQKS